uniref:Uncharacterized protein n=1 Tax=Plectus sambesii TaxID=2011161 RepID=A0A914UXL5_9BILA
MCYRLSLQKANHRGTDMYTVPIQQSGMSYYDSIGHGGGGSSYFDRLPRSSSVSSYRSTNFDNSFTRTLPRRLNTSSLSRPLADYSSPTRTRYTPTTSTSVGLSSKPPLPSTSLYSTSRYNRATNYDVLDANSYGAHRYNNGISHRSASMDRRLGGGGEGTTTFDRRNIYDELGSNGSSSGVGQLANKYERLSVSARSSDSGYRSLTRRTPSPPVLDATAKDSTSARNGYHHQRRDSSSDEVETRDELTSMRATTPSRSIYRSSAASMPDVPSGIRASANAHDSSRTFCRNEPVRSSGSSVESLRSSSSGRRLAKRSTSP